MEKTTVVMEGKAVQLYRAGSGPKVLLIHGIGPGASAPAHFQSLVEGLKDRFELIGVDLFGFGGSVRKSDAPHFDFSMWVHQTHAVLRALGDGPISMIGQSIGGAIALSVAAQAPSVLRVATTATGGGPTCLSPELDAFWRWPRSKEKFRRALRGTVFDAESITEEVAAARLAAVHAADPDGHFDAIMGDKKQANIDATVIPGHVLARVNQPVLMIHGQHDLFFPAEDNALRMSRFLPSADVVVLARCGHNPARERPDATLPQIARFLAA